jgi:2-phosphosulfolactate phosphatase
MSRSASTRQSIQNGVMNYLAQGPYGVRFEWGLAGARALAQSSSCVVVVDVLSFTTSVTVAVEAGMQVYPYAWGDQTASDFARQNQARLAVGRRAVSADTPWSLSPASLRRAPFTPRLVLPSPNGSAICAAASGNGTPVIAACLRNADTVGAYLSERGYGTPKRPVAVIAAGERWPDGSLRPALEDLLGAGAVIAAIRRYGQPLLSPEAEAAQASFAATASSAAAVTNSASGTELTGNGFGEDVAIAVEINSCPLVPVLTGRAFTDRCPQD